MEKNIRYPIGRNGFWNKLKSQSMLQIIVLLGMIYLIIFSYIPMVGIIIAFKDFKLSSGFAGFFTSKWVGLKWYIEFFNDPDFWLIIRNTVVISVLKLIFSFPIPIMLALVINEIANMRVKKVIQTVSYLPHFISWVVVSGLLFAFYNQSDGLINQLHAKIGLKPVDYLISKTAFWPMLVISDVWKEMGWWAIIFLAAIAGVDQSLYEAAIVDGAGRMKRILKITLPSIKGTIIVVLILGIGNLFGGGLGGSNFDQCYLLGNNVNYSVSQILQVYSMNMGLAQGRFSYATAIGLIQSVISLILIFFSNYISKKVSDVGLF